MSQRTPRILVTGSTGQIGWELLRTLAPLGKVVGVSTRTQPWALNLADFDSIRSLVREVKPTLIVNAGAYTAVDKAESEPEVAMAVNGVGPGVLAEECKRLSVPLVHYSTDYVFDGAKAEPYTEADVPNPINVYGKSKLAGEQAIQAVGGQYLIFRTSWVYGTRGKNFLLTMLRLAKERDELHIVDDQVGGPTWSRTIAEATALIIARTAFVGNSWARNLNLADRSGIYHLTGSGRVSWYGFAAEIFERISHVAATSTPLLTPIPSVCYPAVARRPLNSCLVSQICSHDFGIQCPSWREMLELCIDELYGS